MTLTEQNTTSWELSTVSGQQRSTNNQAADMDSIALANDDNENNRAKPSKIMSTDRAICWGILFGALIAGIAFVIILTIWLLSGSSKSSSTTLTTLRRNISTTTVTPATPATPATTSDPCSILRWNTTGQIVAGTGAPGTGPSQLDNPHGIYIDSNNVLYISDFGNNRIQMWVRNASTGLTIAGRSNGAAGSNAISLKDPIDLTFDKNGSMYVVDQANHRIQRFSPNSTNGVTIVGTGNAGNAINELSNPSGITIDEFSNLYIADTGNQRIMKWVTSTATSSILIPTGTLMEPYGITVKTGSSNKIYVGDKLQNHIQLWAAGASQANQTLAGVSPGDLDGPTAFKFDLYGNLYVASSLSRDIRKFCASSTIPEIIVSSSSATSLTTPTGIAFDSNYNLYVADAGNSYVLKFSRL